MDNKGPREHHLRNVAQLAQNADGVVEAGLLRKFFERAPFVWTVLIAMLCGAGYMFVLNYRVNQIEKLSGVYEMEKFPEIIRNNKSYVDLLKGDRGVGIIEQVHNNSSSTDRNAKQIRSLNAKVFGVPDPGEP